MSKKKDKEKFDDIEAVCEEKKEKVKKDKKSKGGNVEVIDSKDAFQLAASSLSSNLFKDTFHAWLYEKEKMTQHRFSSGILGLDTALGGEGLPEGRIIELWGPPSSGKTGLLLEILWHRQQQGLKRYFAGDKSAPVGIVFIDAEHKFDHTLLERWRGGFHPEFTIFVEPHTGESSFHTMLNFAESTGTAAIGLDSICALRQEETLNKTDQATYYGVQAGFIADWLPKLSGAAARTGVPMIIVNQVRANLDGSNQKKYGMNRYKKGGGYSLQHWVAISLYLQKIHDGLVKGTDSKGKIVIENDLYPGQWSKCQIYKNHSGPKFFNDFEAYLEWGHRFLTAAELVRMGTSLGIIKLGGAWYTIGEEKFNGQKNTIVGVDSNLEMQAYLWEEIKKMQLLGRQPITDITDWDLSLVDNGSDDGVEDEPV